MRCSDPLNVQEKDLGVIRYSIRNTISIPSFLFFFDRYKIVFSPGSSSTRKTEKVRVTC